MNIPPFEDKPVVQDAGTSGTVLESIPVFCSFEPGVIALEPSEFLRLLGTGWPLVESRKDCYSLYIGEVRCDLRSYLSKLVYSSFYHRPEVQELVNPYQLPYQSGTFHVIILCDVFCQLRHPGTALDELARILHPDGVLICFEPYTTKRMSRNTNGNIWLHPDRDRAFHETALYDASIPSTLFFSPEWFQELKGWRILQADRYSARYVRHNFQLSTQQKKAEPGHFKRGITGILDRIINSIPWSGIRKFFSDRSTVILTRT